MKQLIAITTVSIASIVSFTLMGVGLTCMGEGSTFSEDGYNLCLMSAVLILAGGMAVAACLSNSPSHEDYL